MAQFTDYIIRQGDTLEYIAENVLGDAERWREIAVLNKLRRPFISDEPIDQYGTPILTGTLAAGIAAGDLAYTLALPVYAATYVANCVFYVQYYEYLDATTKTQAKYDAMALSVAVNEATGVLTFTPTISLTIQPAITISVNAQTVSVTNVTGVALNSKIVVDSGGNLETVVITGFDAVNLTITAIFTKNHVGGTNAQWGFVNSYVAGTVFSLFQPTLELSTRVLRTGDLLRLPGSAGTSLADSTGSGQFVNLLGADIQLDSTGSLVFDANGRLQIVSGTQNLMQALRLRLTTERGSLPHHADYGNPLFGYVGQTTSPNFLNLAQSLARRTLQRDPRVNRVTSINTAQNGAVLSIDAQVEIKRASDLLRIDNIVVKVN